MTVLEWIFVVTFSVLYVALVFTVALMTFQKGYVVLGVFGIFVPILWILGAVLLGAVAVIFYVHGKRELRAAQEV